LSWRPGLIICNPPYGDRLGSELETALLYKKFGETLKANFRHWQAAMIVSDAELGFRMGIRSQKPITFYNGALECKLLRMTIDDKAFFDPKPLTNEDRIERIHKLIDNPYQKFKAKNLVPALDNNNDRKDESSTFMAEIDKTVQNTATSVSTDVGKEHDALSFANRLKKNLKSLSSWKAKNNISCYRVYDADLPEYAAAIDLYEDIDKAVWVNVQEYEPPKTIDPSKANQRLASLMAALPQALGIPKDHISLKIRRKQKQTAQYEKLGDRGDFHVVEEHGCRLQVNFSDYLDTGLFLDHRPMRLLIQQQAQGKRFLNLFAYTGSATVHAAVGGALTTTTVDMSPTYLDWTKRNLALNRSVGKHEFIQADCLEWLAKESAHPYPRQFDLIFLDPPTFSNSKRMDDIFDIQEGHVTLINQTLRLLSKSGVLYFSTNFRRFKLDYNALSPYKIEDISAQSIPPDFARNPKIHYCWRITK
jgi:23S rRNA (guanine2445-N2)-methyltransferase / 23S rRNA (guanine2069-N7)-methyltransferase